MVISLWIVVLLVGGTSRTIPTVGIPHGGSFLFPAGTLILIMINLLV